MADIIEELKPDINMGGKINNATPSQEITAKKGIILRQESPSTGKSNMTLDEDIKKVIETLEMDVIEGSNNIAAVWAKICINYSTIIKDIQNPLGNPVATSVQKGGSSLYIQHGGVDFLEVGKTFLKSLKERYNIKSIQDFFTMSNIVTLKAGIVLSASALVAELSSTVSTLSSTVSTLYQDNISQLFQSHLIPPISHYMTIIAGASAPLITNVGEFLLGAGLASVAIGIGSRVKEHLFTGVEYKFKTKDNIVYSSLSKRPVTTLISIPNTKEEDITIKTDGLPVHVSYFTNSDVSRTMKFSNSGGELTDNNILFTLEEMAQIAIVNKKDIYMFTKNNEGTNFMFNDGTPLLKSSDKVYLLLNLNGNKLWSGSTVVGDSTPKTITLKDNIYRQTSNELNEIPLDTGGGKIDGFEIKFNEQDNIGGIAEGGRTSGRVVETDNVIILTKTNFTEKMSEFIKTILRTEGDIYTKDGSGLIDTILPILGLCMLYTQLNMIIKNSFNEEPRFLKNDENDYFINVTKLKQEVSASDDTVSLLQTKYDEQYNLYKQFIVDPTEIIVKTLYTWNTNFIAKNKGTEITTAQLVPTQLAKKSDKYMMKGGVDPATLGAAAVVAGEDIIKTAVEASRRLRKKSVIQNRSFFRATKLIDGNNNVKYNRIMINLHNNYNLVYNNSGNLSEKELFQMKGNCLLHILINQTLEKNEPLSDEEVVKLLQSELFRKGMVASNTIDVLYTLISPEMKEIVKGVYKKENTHKYLYFLKDSLNSYSNRVLDQSTVLGNSFMDEIRKINFDKLDRVNYESIKQRAIKGSNYLLNRQFISYRLKQSIKMSYRKVIESTKKLVAKLIGIQYKNLTEGTNMLLMDWSHSNDEKVKQLYKKGYPISGLSVSSIVNIMKKDPIQYFTLSKISNDKLYLSIKEGLRDFLVKGDLDIYTNKKSNYDYLFYSDQVNKTLLYTDLYHKFIENLLKTQGDSNQKTIISKLLSRYISIANKYYINNYIPIDFKNDAYKIFSKEWSELSSKYKSTGTKEITKGDFMNGKWSSESGTDKDKYVEVTNTGYIEDKFKAKGYTGKIEIKITSAATEVKEKITKHFNEKVSQEKTLSKFDPYFLNTILSELNKIMYKNPEKYDKINNVDGVEFLKATLDRDKFNTAFNEFYGKSYELYSAMNNYPTVNNLNFFQIFNKEESGQELSAQNEENVNRGILNDKTNPRMDERDKNYIDEKFRPPKFLQEVCIMLNVNKGSQTGEEWGNNEANANCMDAIKENMYEIYTDWLRIQALTKAISNEPGKQLKGESTRQYYYRDTDIYKLPEKITLKGNFPLYGGEEPPVNYVGKIIVDPTKNGIVIVNITKDGENKHILKLTYSGTTSINEDVFNNYYKDLYNRIDGDPNNPLLKTDSYRTYLSQLQININKNKTNKANSESTLKKYMREKEKYERELSDTRRYGRGGVDDLGRINKDISTSQTKIDEEEKKIEKAVNEISRYETTYNNLIENVKLMKSKYEEELLQFKQKYDSEMSKLKTTEETKKKVLSYTELIKNYDKNVIEFTTFCKKQIVNENIIDKLNDQFKPLISSTNYLTARGLKNFIPFIETYFKGLNDRKGSLNIKYRESKGGDLKDTDLIFRIIKHKDKEYAEAINDINMGVMSATGDNIKQYISENGADGIINWSNLKGESEKEIISHLYKDINERDYNYFYNLHKIIDLDKLLDEGTKKYMKGFIEALGADKTFDIIKESISNNIIGGIYEGETKKSLFTDKYYYLKKIGVDQRLTNDKNKEAITNAIDNLFMDDKISSINKLFTIIRVYHIIKNDFPFYLYQPTKYTDKSSITSIDDIKISDIQNLTLQEISYIMVSNDLDKKIFSEDILYAEYAIYNRINKSTDNIKTDQNLKWDDYIKFLFSYHVLLTICNKYIVSINELKRLADKYDTRFRGKLKKGVRDNMILNKLKRILSKYNILELESSLKMSEVTGLLDPVESLRRLKEPERKYAYDLVIKGRKRPIINQLNLLIQALNKSYQTNQAIRRRVKADLAKTRKKIISTAIKSQKALRQGKKDLTLKKEKILEERKQQRGEVIKKYQEKKQQEEDRRAEILKEMQESRRAAEEKKVSEAKSEEAKSEEAKGEAKGEAKDEAKGDEETKDEASSLLDIFSSKKKEETKQPEKAIGDDFVSISKRELYELKAVESRLKKQMVEDKIRMNDYRIFLNKQLSKKLDELESMEQLMKKKYKGEYVDIESLREKLNQSIGMKLKLLDEQEKILNSRRLKDKIELEKERTMFTEALKRELTKERNRLKQSYSKSLTNQKRILLDQLKGNVGDNMWKQQLYNKLSMDIEDDTIMVQKKRDRTYKKKKHIREKTHKKKFKNPDRGVYSVKDFLYIK